MPITQVLSIIIAIMTLLTEIALIVGLVWSIVTVKPIILTVVLIMLAAGFGVFVFYDYKKFFGSKPPSAPQQ